MLEAAGQTGTRRRPIAGRRFAGLNLRHIQARDLRLFSATGAPPEIWEPTIRLVERTGIDLTHVVSEVLSFRHCADGFDAARSPLTHGKVMFRP